MYPVYIKNLFIYYYYIYYIEFNLLVIYKIKKTVQAYQLLIVKLFFIILYFFLNYKYKNILVYIVSFNFINISLKY